MEYELNTMLEAAACLWEAVQEAQGNGVTTPGLESYLVQMRAAFRSQGVAAIRGAVVDSAMVAALETGYRAAVAEGFDSPFDWEFCPAFVRDCMEWDSAGLPTLRADYLDRCKAIGRVGTGLRGVFRSVYFAQGEEAAPDLDKINRDGAAAWLAELSGAVDLFSVDSDAAAAPPWGQDDRCEHVETTKAGRGYVHRHRGGLYVSVTTETAE